MYEQSYTIVLAPAEEGGFTVTCPDLPGVITDGDTFEDALEQAKEAIEVFIESLMKDGEPVPASRSVPQGKLQASVHVTIPQLV